MEDLRLNSTLTGAFPPFDPTQFQEGEPAAIITEAPAGSSSDVEVDPDTLERGLIDKACDLAILGLLPRIKTPIAVNCLCRALQSNYSGKTVEPILMRAIELDPDIDTETCMYWVLYDRVKRAEEEGEIPNKNPSHAVPGDRRNAYTNLIIERFLSQAQHVDSRTVEEMLRLNLPKPLIDMALTKVRVLDASRAQIFVPRLIGLNDGKLFTLYLHRGGVIDQPTQYFFSAFSRKCDETIIVALCDSLEARGDRGVQLINNVDLEDLHNSGYSYKTVRRIRTLMGFRADNGCVIL